MWVRRRRLPVRPDIMRAMGIIRLYVMTAWIGLIFLMIGVAGALVIGEYWHVIGHEYFATCLGVPGASEHGLAFMALTLMVSGAVAVYVNSWQKDSPADLASGLLTGIAMLSISTLFVYLWGDVHVNDWYNLVEMLKIALALIGLPTVGSVAFYRTFMADKRNGKISQLVLLITVLLSVLAFAVLPEMIFSMVF
jgi:hypothetical protein